MISEIVHEIRKDIVERLSFLGFSIKDEINCKCEFAPYIELSNTKSKLVYVISTNESDVLTHHGHIFLNKR